MAESSDDRNQEEPVSPDREEGADSAETSRRDESGQPESDQAAQADSQGPNDRDHDEYGQYEEDWQESDNRPQETDDFWPGDEEDEPQDDNEYEQDDDYSLDTYEDDYDDDYEDDYDYDDEEEEEDDGDGDGNEKMTLVEHLDELRTRIIRAALGLVIGMAVSLALSPQMIEVINRPYFNAMGEKPLVYNDMISVFTLYLRISLYMGILIASPWIFYQLWMFISAGLYKHERKYVTYAVPFSALLFISGALFFLFYISPMILQAFRIFNEWFGQGQLEAFVTLSNHVTFMTNMMMVFGFCFQMPIAVLLLGKMGIVTVKTLGQYRKFVIVGILILAAFVTSPSPLDQIALALPMWLLFELGVLLVYLLVERKRRAEDAAMGYSDLEED